MNPILYAIPVFFLSIAIEALLGWRRGQKIYDLSDAITSLQFGVLSQVSGVFYKLISLGIYSFISSHAALQRWPSNSVGAWIAALILYDFCYYWLHRCSHEIGVLWAAHVVHHSSEYYNLSTALRQTSTGTLFGWIFYIPMALLGVSPVMFVTVGLIDLLYQYWVHTELIGRLGWFDRVFVSPSNHRVHHGQNDYCIDRNYGGILIVWDRLFGSFVEEREGEPICFGIRKALHSFNPIWGNVHHYVDMWHAMCGAKGVGAKLSAWIAPPGGWREGPVEHFETANFVRYRSATAASLKYVAVGGYIFLNVAATVFLIKFEVLNQTNYVFAVVSALGLAVLAWLIGAALMRRPPQPSRERH